MNEVGLGYIVGTELRGMPLAVQAGILDDKRYEPAEEGGYRVLSLDTSTSSQRLIVGYSPVQAAKDQRNCERGIAQWQNRLSRSSTPKALLRNTKYSQFLVVENTGKVRVDLAAVAASARWDGRHGVITNLPDTTGASIILNQYRGLCQVKEALRIVKSDLRIYPTLHWTPQRVQAHIAVAFMTLLCVRHLQYRMNLQQNVSVTPEIITQALTSVRHSLLEDRKTGRRYAIPSVVNETAQKLYKVMQQTYARETFELN